MFQKRFARREFVRRAAVMGTGLVGLPHLIPSSALGDAGQLPPSQRIGIAFIGPGHRGTQLVREFAGRGDVEPLADWLGRPLRYDPVAAEFPATSTRARERAAYLSIGSDRRPYVSGRRRVSD